MPKRTRASMRPYSDQRAEFMALLIDQQVAYSAILKDLHDGRAPPGQTEFLACVARARRMMELIDGGKNGELSMQTNFLLSDDPVAA